MRSSCCLLFFTSLIKWNDTKTQWISVDFVWGERRKKSQEIGFKKTGMMIQVDSSLLLFGIKRQVKEFDCRCEESNVEKKAVMMVMIMSIESLPLCWGGEWKGLGWVSYFYDCGEEWRSYILLLEGKKKKAGKEIETKRIRGWESVLKRDEGVSLGYKMYPLRERGS